LSILPPTWLLKPINEVFEINPRVFCALSTARDLPVHFVPMKAVGEDAGGISIEDVRPLSQVMRGYTAFTEGDVIFAKITPCMENGKLAVVPKLKYQIAYGSTEFHVLRATGLVNPCWLARYLSQASVRRAAKRNMTGSAGQLRVPTEWFSTCEMPIPPLPEQERIITALQRLLAELDVAVSKLERIKSNLKRYRASVLQAAVEGRLTAEWRKENPPSETGAELLARLLKIRRAKWEENQLKKYTEQCKTPPKNWKEKYPEPAKPDTTGLPELPEGWVWASLHQLSWDSSYGTSDKCRYDATGLAVIGIPNIKNGSLCLKNVKYASGSLHIPANDLIAPGDALIIRTNGSKGLIGRMAIITNKPIHPLYYASYLIRFRVVNINRLSSWLGRIWDISLIRNWIEDRAATSAGQHNISMSTLNALPIPIPTITEQTQAISVIDSRLEMADVLDETLDNALKRAAILRQSILKRAFEGRLMPQDPNDEPASMLLERIRAERAEQAATVKPARTKRKRKGDAI